MKLITAIVNKEDSKNVCNELIKAKFYVTRLATTGGFLMAGNMTLLICTEDEKVDDCIGIISQCCKQRTEIVPGTDGLIHISQISKTRIAQPSDVLEIGEEVEVKIIDIDEEKQKVSLSIRALIEDAEAAAAAEDAEKVEAVAETDETPADAE